MENKKVITIYYPPKNWLENRAKELDRSYNKQTLESKYSYALKMMNRQNTDILLKPVEAVPTGAKDEEYAKKLINLFIKEGGAKLKLDWARINALLDCDPRNLIGIVDFAVYTTAPDMLLKLARLHCMTMSKAWKLLGNKSDLKEERGYYSYYYGVEPPKQWKLSVATLNLDLMVNYAYAPEKSDEPGQNPYRAKDIFYLLPKAELIIWNFYKRYGIDSSLIPIKKIEDGLKIYSGSDFISQIPIFEGMKTAGIIKAGATKVPITVAKKIANLMTLESLPRVEHAMIDRCYILAYLGAYVAIPANNNKNSSDLEAMAKTYLKAMYDKVRINDEKVLKMYLAESTPKIGKRCLETMLYSAGSMVEYMKNIFNKLPVDAENNGLWVRYDNVVDWVEYVEACETSRVNWLGTSNSYVELDNGNYLYYPDYYTRLKMPVIDGTLQMFASLGLIDFAYENIDDDHQEIRYVRITNAGLWIAKRTKGLNVEIPKVDDGLHFDPETLMITIRDTNSPNYALLEDLTEKISAKRYRITEGALLRGCRTLPELISREKRLKDYLLKGAESTNLTILTGKLYSKVNKVKPTEDDEYYCMDVDPDDKELHALITGNAQIRKNTLRVEGWKLLVKKHFYSTFLEKLRQAGYLTES